MHIEQSTAPAHEPEPVSKTRQDSSSKFDDWPARFDHRGRRGERRRPVTPAAAFPSNSHAPSSARPIRSPPKDNAISHPALRLPERRCRAPDRPRDDGSTDGRAPADPPRKSGKPRAGVNVIYQFAPLASTGSAVRSQRGSRILGSPCRPRRQGEIPALPVRERWRNRTCYRCCRVSQPGYPAGSDVRACARSRVTRNLWVCAYAPGRPRRPRSDAVHVHLQRGREFSWISATALPARVPAVHVHLLRPQLAIRISSLTTRAQLRVWRFRASTRRMLFCSAD